MDTPATTPTEEPRPLGRSWHARGLRLLLGVIVLAALAFVGRRYYGELGRLTSVRPVWLIAMAGLYLLTRALAADVLSSSLRTVGHHVGRGEAFLVLMVQYYTNMLIPRAGIGAPATYLKVRRNIPVADFSAVQLLSLSLVQYFCLGAGGLAATALTASRGGHRPPRAAVVVFAAAAIGSALAIAVPFYRLTPRRWAAGNWVARFTAQFSGSYRTLSRHPLLIVRCVAAQAAILGLRAARMQIAFLAIGQPVSYLGAFVASALADLAFVVSVTPAALGFREGAIVYVAPLLGTTREIALSAAVLDRVVLTACNILVAQIGIWKLLRPAAQSATPEARMYIRG